MSVHDVDSPTHGPLRVVTSERPDGDRPWQAALDPRPPRLAHLVAFHAATEAEAIDGLLAAAERHDATGIVLRSREQEGP